MKKKVFRGLLITYIYITAVYIRPAAGRVLCRYSSGINIVYTDFNPALNTHLTRGLRPQTPAPPGQDVYVPVARRIYTSIYYG